MLKRLWREDEGILTFEWIMLLTLLVIGVIGSVAGIRDAIQADCQQVVGAIASLNTSYIVGPGLGVDVGSTVAGQTSSQDCSTATGFSYTGSNSIDTFVEGNTSTVANGGTGTCPLGP